MERIEAKQKVAVLVSNYVRLPRGRKLPGGTVDRLTDRLLGDFLASRELEGLDPNDDRSAATFVDSFRDLFRGAADPPRRRNEREDLRDRSELDRVREIARPRTIPSVGAKRDAFAFLYLAVNGADCDVPEAVLEAVLYLDDVLERNRFDGRDLARLVPIAERLASLPPGAPFVRVTAIMLDSIPRKSCDRLILGLATELSM